MSDLMQPLAALGIPEAVLRFSTSLAIGLLMGLERERNPAAKAGLRTFALVALLGAVAALLGEEVALPWPLAAGMLITGLMTIAAYLRETKPDADPGTTTIAALVLCYSLGAAVWIGYTAEAVMIAIVATILLYFKAELRGMTQSLTRRDLVSIFQFAVLTFIVLPILPDENFGPYGALNPHQAWLMVVLISGVSLAGYVALRIAGTRYGVLMVGVFGGLVSSTATTLVYSRHASGHPAVLDPAAVVVLLANLVLLARIVILAAVLSPDLVPQVALILGAGGLVGLAAALFRWWRMNHVQKPPEVDVSNPTELRAALGFGALYAAVLVLAAWLSDVAGARGLYAVALASGLTDVDAITLSSLRLHEMDRILGMQAVTAIGLAVLANIAFKWGLTFFAGGRPLALRCAPGMGGAALGIAAGLLAL